MGVCDFGCVALNPNSNQDIPNFNKNNSNKCKNAVIIEPESCDTGNCGKRYAILEIFYFDKDNNPSSLVEFVEKISKNEYTKKDHMTVGFSWGNIDFEPHLFYSEMTDYTTSPVWEFDPAKIGNDLNSSSYLSDQFQDLYENGTRIWIRNWTTDGYHRYSSKGEWDDYISDKELCYIAGEYDLSVTGKQRYQIYQEIKDKIKQKFGV